MPESVKEKRRHFVLDGVTETEGYRPPVRHGARQSVLERDRASHGSVLLGHFQELKEEAEVVIESQREAGLDDGLGLQVEFESFPDVELAFESLARERQGIELLNVRHADDRTFATVFVPEGKLVHFEKVLSDYLEEKKDRSGRPRDNKKLVNAIQAIRAATLRALWTDDADAYPESETETLWWEIWLPVRGDRRRTVENFRQRASLQDIRVAPGEVEFPERTVLLVSASKGQMERSLVTLNSIAELRRAKETADFFDDLTPEEQVEWLDDLMGRIDYENPSADPVHVCLLDTGVNRGHPLLVGGIAERDLHSVEPAWGVDDLDGHGTAMAGLALAGNITDILDSTKSVPIRHRLESVKLLPTDGANSNDARHHGYLTKEAVARPEITAPERKRLFGMAVTARDNRDRGRPSAWSAAVDGIAADVDGLGASPRLVIVSAGNVRDNAAWADYPFSNDSDGIHDPAQAWNALTVGAFTELVNITEKNATDYSAIAPSGGLSPFSTTSLKWQPHWPLKPDICLEGGNAAKNSLGAVTMPSLSLLTTNNRSADRLFTVANATSASTALAARMAATVMETYPDLWPETVRGLLVHSAEWTEAMRQAYLPTGKPKKNDFVQLVQRCGFGVPDLGRALWSVSNSLTMIVQASVQPFESVEGAEPKLRDMNLHKLPWPRDLLEELGAAEVEMRVTLSYFIEPNPSRRGVRSRYRYESHGLRFDVKRASESESDFRNRINAAARDEEEGTLGRSSDPAWLIGSNARHRGSLHSDMWRGRAADLASRETLAVYPSLGWWKTRRRLERFNKLARYALLVSIRAPDVDVDLYSDIANQIDVPVVVEV